jgi:hypothetical protein
MDSRLSEKKQEGGACKYAKDLENRMQRVTSLLFTCFMVGRLSLPFTCLIASPAPL